MQESVTGTGTREYREGAMRMPSREHAIHGAGPCSAKSVTLRHPLRKEGPMHFRSLTTLPARLLPCGLGAALLMLSASDAMAIVIAGGSPLTTAPPYVDATIGPDQLLLPIEVTGAAGLQDWRFDLRFDPTVVQQVDLGGFYNGVYAAEFNSQQPVLSSITSSGFGFEGLLEGVAGFSSDVTGDGLLAFIGFQFLPGQGDQDPGFALSGITATQSVLPEPATAGLLAVGLLVVRLLRWYRRSGRSLSTRACREERVGL